MDNQRIPLGRRAAALVIARVGLWAIDHGFASEAGPGQIEPKREELQRLLRTAKSGNRSDYRAN